MEKFRCKVCQRNAFDCPQLKDEVWLTIAEPHDFLCLEHAEQLLGRHITPDDLAPCPANAYAKALAKRLKKKRPVDKKGLAATA